MRQVGPLKKIAAIKPGRQYQCISSPDSQIVAEDANGHLMGSGCNYPET
jgi:hypothetical protein